MVRRVVSLTTHLSVISLIATTVAISGCRSVDDDPVSRGGEEADNRAAKANAQVGHSPSPDGEESSSSSPSSPSEAAEDAIDAGDCAKTINCGTGGTCSCGSGANFGKVCDRPSGECDSLCGKC